MSVLEVLEWIGCVQLYVSAVGEDCDCGWRAYRNLEGQVKGWLIYVSDERINRVLILFL